MIQYSPFCKKYFLALSLLFVCSIHAMAQLTFTDQAGGFGPFIGRVVSNLGQPMIEGQPSSSIFDHQGWEFGIKSEIYRTTYLRGNLMASYIQLGSREFIPSETDFREVNVNLQAIKVALNPLLFKIGNDFIHGYAGAGIYGTFLFDQEVESDVNTDNYWQSEELKEIDYGLDLVAGVHVWSFDIEFHAQLGASEMGKRFDGTPVKQQFFGISLAYLYVNQHVTRKSCKNKKSLKRMY